MRQLISYCVDNGTTLSDSCQPITVCICLHFPENRFSELRANHFLLILKTCSQLLHMIMVSDLMSCRQTQYSSQLPLMRTPLGLRNLIAVPIIGVSVIARCRQGES